MGSTTLAHSAHETLGAADIGIFEDVIRTEMNYILKDPKHEYEKPYEIINFDPGEEIPSTNMATDSKPVTVHDFRQRLNPLSFKDYGFSSAKIDCALTNSEIDDEKKVKQKYYPAINKLLWQEFPDAAEIKTCCVYILVSPNSRSSDNVAASFAGGERN
jgi:hypothetical protein